MWCQFQAAISKNASNAKFSFNGLRDRVMRSTRESSQMMRPFFRNKRFYSKKRNKEEETEELSKEARNFAKYKPIVSAKGKSPSQLAKDLLNKKESESIVRKDGNRRKSTSNKIQTNTKTKLKEEKFWHQLLLHAIQEMRKDDTSEIPFERIEKAGVHKNLKPADPVTPMVFALMDREAEVLQIAEAVINHFLSCYTRSGSNKDWYLIAITGGSGTGKTRLSISALSLTADYLAKDKVSALKFIEEVIGKHPNKAKIEIPDLYDLMLESLRHQRTLYVDFSKEDFFDGWVRKPKESFLLTIISKLYFTEEQVGVIYQLLGENFHVSMNTPTVARAIRAVIEVPTEKPITIAVNIDEIQQRITEKDLATLITPNSSKNHILIRRIAMTIMSTIQDLARERIYVIPIFSGTLSMHFAGIFPATLYTLTQITPSPLKNQSSVQLIKNALENHISEPLILSMGNIPRALEYLVAAYRRNKSEKEIFKDVVSMLIGRYKISTASMPESRLRRLIEYCLSGQLVTRTDMIEGIKLGTLEREGLIFLKPVPNEEYQFQVIFPLAFAAAFNEFFKIFDPEFVTFRPIATFSELEKFGRDFEVFQNNFLYSLGKREMTLGERYSGALMSPTLASTPITLEYMSGYHSKDESLPTKGSEIVVMDRLTPVNLADECASVWIGRGCTVCDTVTSLPQPNKKTLIRLEEWKSTIVFQEASSAGIRPGEIITERHNAFVEEIRQNFPSKKFDVYFAFMSNARLPTSEEELQNEILKSDDTMIVTRDQFQRRFSPIFACLALGDIIDDTQKIKEKQQKQKKHSKKTAKTKKH